MACSRKTTKHFCFTCYDVCIKSGQSRFLQSKFAALAVEVSVEIVTQDLTDRDFKYKLIEESLSAFTAPQARQFRSSLEYLSVRFLEKLLTNRGKGASTESSAFLSLLSMFAHHDRQVFPSEVASHLINHISYRLGKIEIISLRFFHAQLFGVLLANCDAGAVPQY
jgi:hypothetical protein